MSESTGMLVRTRDDDLFTNPEALALTGALVVCTTGSPPAWGRRRAASSTIRAAFKPRNRSRSSSGAAKVRCRNCTIVRIRADRAERFTTINVRNASA